MPALSHDRYCDEIADQLGRLRSVVASGADLSTPVPTCPDWTLEQLVRHMGGVLRWVELHVRTRAAQSIPMTEVPGYAGPEVQGDAQALDAWLAESGDLLVGSLRAAGPDVAVWSWAGIPTSGFWARRMTHELTVHRADATLAAGLPYEVAPEIAADAIEERLEIVAWAQRTRPGDTGARELRRGGDTIALHAQDAEPPWLIELADDGLTWRRARADATVTLSGPLTAVLLAFYRRLPLDAPELGITGDRELLAFWLTRTSFG
ncbi:maleylpyruvate isomerase family mycothiol-dependent enzyme [Streptomyces sp. NPDC091279]|uniref:maleylpyruvate isomerase family mycothiol-dependent enzyme n=1 Tax=Streptomyces sp. NPDC091279 TaxID=3365983 RepID=UPI0037F9C351